MTLNKLNIKVSPTDIDRNWKVLEGIIYKGAYVPKGFITDGASIPKYLRNFFPHGGRKFAPAVVHDVLYRTIDHKFSREEADDLFLDAMLYNGVNKITAMIIYKAVRYFGWITWNKNRRDK